MNAQVTWSLLRTYVLTSALIVLLYAVLGRLIGLSHSPTTIKHFLVLYVLHLGLIVVVHFYRNWKKKSPALPEAR